jgi:hypothetical protein
MKDDDTFSLEQLNMIATYSLCLASDQNELIESLAKAFKSLLFLSHQNQIKSMLRVKSTYMPAVKNVYKRLEVRYSHDTVYNEIKGLTSTTISWF